jgi:hypothetical protein
LKARSLFSVSALLLVSAVAFAESPNLPTVLIDANPSFTAALTAAVEKKQVPVQVITNKDNADFILHSAEVYSKDESGAGKVARCMFMDCIGVNGYSSVSVTLEKHEAVVWAYQVRKGNSGPLGIQSLSEAIAKLRIFVIAKSAISPCSSQSEMQLS